MLKRNSFPLCTCTMIRQASRVVTQHYDKALLNTGLRMSQLSVLMMLREVGSKNIHELAERLVLDRTTLGRNLRPLERAGFLEIEQSGEDGRARLVVLTKKGEATTAKAIEKWEKAQADFHNAIGRENAIALSKLLRGVVKSAFSK
jgi:DNA-binding MarR family transcriptional regulator